MEQFYHFLWKSGMLGRNLKELSGADIDVIDPGIHNMGAGPDFFNSKVKIGDTNWVGNVEIHVKASDWHRHGHDADDAYNNVILHVVGISDTRIKRPDGSLIPQIELKFPPQFFNTVAALSEKIDNVRCAPMLRQLSTLLINDWIDSLMVERIQAKGARVMQTLSITGNNWEQTCFIMTARSLGFGLNSDPFEMLARSIPLQIISHHCDNPMQLQAIFFGQAGMLDSSTHIFDEFYQLLCREYYFLAKKYELRPMNPSLWKYSRTRPQNFPHRRIAYLAKMCEGGFSLFKEITQLCPDIEGLYGVLDKRLDGYWESHFAFDTPGSRLPLGLSDASMALMLINAVVPLVYVYSIKTSNLRLEEKALDLLLKLPPENNMIIRQWKSLGIPATNAGESQALLHLRKEYCDARKCFYCRFGIKLLSTSSEI